LVFAALLACGSEGCISMTHNVQNIFFFDRPMMMTTPQRLPTKYILYTPYGKDFSKVVAFTKRHFAVLYGCLDTKSSTDLCRLGRSVARKGCRNRRLDTWGRGCLLYPQQASLDGFGSSDPNSERKPLTRVFLHKQAREFTGDGGVGSGESTRTIAPLVPMPKSSSVVAPRRHRRATALAQINPSGSTDPYRILPPHTAAERQAIRESILSIGWQGGVILDTEGHVIDGHLRRDLCTELGIDWMVGADVRIGLNDVQKRAMAISLNLARRSTAPTAKQRREYAKTLLLANPESSDPSISAIVGLSHQTINRIRGQLAQKGKLKLPLKTVGKDGKTRAVSSEKRKARFQVKSKKEYDRIAPVAHELQSSPKLTNGIIRRPNRLPAMLRREKALARVEKSKARPILSSIDIRCCDFRKLEIEPNSVDLICTDIVWGKNFQQDWEDLARLAATWLKPTGLFTTIIGQGYLDKCLAELSKHLNYAWTFCCTFKGSSRAIHSNIVEGWRPIVVFSRAKKVDFHWVLDRIEISDPPEKDYDDWQQSLPGVKELIRRLLPREGTPLVVDPHLGTGTSAVACCQLSTSEDAQGIRFVGCDIDPEKVQIAKYRVAQEGNNKEVG
jgi:hypothetical protein